MTFHPDTLGDLSGKVYIVTGGNTGIGYYTVAHLAKHGAKTYMCARSEAKGQAAIESIKALNKNADVSLILMDHSDLASVVSAAKHFLAHEHLLHGLVNNAGIMATPFEITKDGYEAQWQTNYIAHYIFTALLIPLMLSTSRTSPVGTVRIVNVSSSAHSAAPAGGINFADTTLGGNKLASYGQSKLANILHARTLNKMYGPGSESARNGNGEILTAVVHPGPVNTQLETQAKDLVLRVYLTVWRMFGGFTDPDTGSWTNLYCVASDEITREKSGGYFKRIAQPGNETELAKDMNLAAELEKWTVAEMEKGKWLV